MNPNEPLGLPKGSVRAILSVLIVGAAVIDAIINGAPNAALTAMASSVTTWYFLNRGAADAVPAEEIPADPFAEDD